MPFANSLGWYAFLALLPLVLLYFIRPQPKKSVIPSLMFFYRERGFLKNAFFIRYFLHNLLLLLHFAAVSLLALALTAPYLFVSSAASSENTAFVIDASASMQVDEGGKTRFEQAVDTARRLQDGRVTIVLATNLPLVLLERGTGNEASRMLGSLAPADTTTNLGDAMLAAGSALAGQKGKVYVLSDFRNNEGPDPIAAKRVLLSQGQDVEFINLIGEAGNAGMVGLSIDRRTTDVRVKNYHDEALGVSLQVNGQRAAAASLLPGSTETLSFTTPQGTSRVDLLPADTFMTDNILYLSAPDTAKIRVLLITNERSSNLQAALESSPDIALHIAEPPVVPDFNYDVIFIHDVRLDFMLPGFYDALRDRVAEGASLVIAAQEDSLDVHFDLLPVTLRQLQDESSAVLFSSTTFTKHVAYAHVVSRYFDAVPKEGAAVVATAERGGAPLLALRQHKLGTVVYYGLFDDASTFKSSTEYPVFWNLLVNHLVQREDLAAYNLQTGRTEAIAEQRVETPAGAFRTSRLLFDRVGLYQYGGRTVAANLLSPEESAVSGTSEKLLDEESALVVEPRKELAKQDLVLPLALAVFIILVLELLYIKHRGDL